jgi:hypothetical protein
MKDEGRREKEEGRREKGKGRRMKPVCCLSDYLLYYAKWQVGCAYEQ